MVPNLYLIGFTVAARGLAMFVRVTFSVAISLSE